jgi:hypothetical protein
MVSAAERQAACDHRSKHELPRIAVRGKWYRRWSCGHCHKQWSEYDRDVDQRSLTDCEAADASQGIV